MNKLARYLATIFILAIFPLACSFSEDGPLQEKSMLINGHKLPYKGTNFTYFSPFSYFVLNRAWVESNVKNTVLEAYDICEKTCPGKKFILMECSKKKGGRMWPHRTHLKGRSIDFATPLIKKGKPYNFHRYYGLLHYAMAFDNNGVSKRNKNISIDFETMAKHILALDKSARKHGLYIKKVILKTDLKDNFYKTKSGKIVKKKNIYFAKKLPKLVDDLHDDHYHVDFGIL